MKQTAEQGKQILVNWLKANGYELDRFGHWHKTTKSGQKARVKMQACSARIERQADICGSNEWLKLASAYYKDIRVLIDGRLGGFKR